MRDDSEIFLWKVGGCFSNPEPHGNLVPLSGLLQLFDARGWSVFGHLDDISTIWMLIDGKEVQEIKQSTA